MNIKELESFDVAFLYNKPEYYSYKLDKVSLKLDGPPEMILNFEVDLQYIDEYIVAKYNYYINFEEECSNCLKTYNDHIEGVEYINFGFINTKEVDTRGKKLSKKDYNKLKAKQDNNAQPDDSIEESEYYVNNNKIDLIKPLTDLAILNESLKPLCNECRSKNEK